MQVTIFNNFITSKAFIWLNTLALLLVYIYMKITLISVYENFKIGHVFGVMAIC